MRMNNRAFAGLNKTSFVALIIFYSVLWTVVVTQVFNPIALDMTQQGIEYDSAFSTEAAVQNYTTQSLERERGFWSSISFALDSVWDAGVSFLSFFAGGSLVVEHAPAWFIALLATWNGAVAFFGLWLIIELFRGV